MTELPYLNPADIDTTHTPTAVNKEDKLPLHPAQVRGHGLQVRAEVKHNHRVVKNVFMKPFMDDIHLFRTRENHESRESLNNTAYILRGLFNLKRFLFLWLEHEDVVIIQYLEL